MGSKGSVKNYERELSPQELELLQTQNEQLKAGIEIAREAEDRSADQYKNWQNTYQGIETGLIPRGASRANGYYAPDQASPDTRLFSGGQGQGMMSRNRMPQRDNAQAMAQYQQVMKNGKGV